MDLSSLQEGTVTYNSGGSNPNLGILHPDTPLPGQQPQHYTQPAEQQHVGEQHDAGQQVAGQQQPVEQQQQQPVGQQQQQQQQDAGGSHAPPSVSQVDGAAETSSSSELSDAARRFRHFGPYDCPVLPTSIQFITRGGVDVGYHSHSRSGSISSTTASTLTDSDSGSDQHGPQPSDSLSPLKRQRRTLGNAVGTAT